METQMNLETMGARTQVGEKLPLYEEYIKSAYQELTHLSKKEGAETVLVQHRGSGRIAVKKNVSVEAAGIYQALREFNHPNIVKVYEVCHNEKASIVIEEYISGETLESKLEDGLLPDEKVIKYTVQLLDALQEIQKKNIIHRDITPANVIISSDDVVKLIDFGISRSRKEEQKKDTCILGTVGYAAPEQFGFQQTDITTDFYALGVLINVMLTGKLPAEKMTDNKKFAKIVRKCVQMDPAKRYQSAAKIRQDLVGQAIGREQNADRKDVNVFPGFRSDVRWKKVVGIAGYALMTLYAIGTIAQSLANVTAFLLELVSLMLLAMTFLVASNFARWDRRLFPFRKLSKEICVAIRVIVCVLLFSFAMELDSYVGSEILKRM